MVTVTKQATLQSLSLQSFNSVILRRTKKKIKLLLKNILRGFNWTQTDRATVSFSIVISSPTVPPLSLLSLNGRSTHLLSKVSVFCVYLYKDPGQKEKEVKEQNRSSRLASKHKLERHQSSSGQMIQKDKQPIRFTSSDQKNTTTGLKI